LSGSCPQLLDMTLRASQNPVDQEGIGVSGDATMFVASLAVPGAFGRYGVPTS
jgi:hypothetical protein